MTLPRVVIVGRPNVGKSSLFNWLAQKRIAITDAQAGVTRDRLTFVLAIDDRWCELVDTGGIGHIDEDDLTDEIERQITIAIQTADMILFVVDGREGLNARDLEIDRRLRTVGAPVILVANKCDSERYDLTADEFHQMGRDPLVKVSVQNNRGFRDLQKAVKKQLPKSSGHEARENEPTMKVAIVGRRNVGKSTFINTLAQEERMIVSEVPGTTRDSVDVRFELDGKAFMAIDTPGLRRRKSTNSNIDYYGLHRAQRSIRRADVVLLFFDSGEEVSRVEKQLAGYIEENFKPCIFVVNKWDKFAGEIPTENWAEYLRYQFPSMWYVPIGFITGQTGKNVKTLVNHCQMLFKQAQSRIETPDLNRLIKAALARNSPPVVKGKRGKVYFATQVDVTPPTFALMCNHPLAFTEGYRKYLLGVFRDQLSFGEVPIRVLYRKRAEHAGGKPSADAETDVEDLEVGEEAYSVWEEAVRRSTQKRVDVDDEDDDDYQDYVEEHKFTGKKTSAEAEAEAEDDEEEGDFAEMDFVEDTAEFEEEADDFDEEEDADFEEEDEDDVEDADDVESAGSAESESPVAKLEGDPQGKPANLSAATPVGDGAAAEAAAEPHRGNGE